MGSMISEKYVAWQVECEERFQQLKIDGSGLAETCVFFKTLPKSFQLP